MTDQQEQEEQPELTWFRPSPMLRAGTSRKLSFQGEQQQYPPMTTWVVPSSRLTAGLAPPPPPPIKGGSTSGYSQDYHNNNRNYNNNNNNNQYTTQAPTSSYYTASAGSVYSEAAVAGVWTYMIYVSTLLVLFVLSLILPKGLRKQVMGANPRRYSRRRYAATEIGDMNMSAAGTSALMTDSVDETFLLDVENRRKEDNSAISTLTPTLNGSNDNIGNIVNNNGNNNNGPQQQNHQQSISTPSQDPPPLQQNTNYMSRPPRSTISDSESGVGSVFLRPMIRGSATRGSRSNSSPYGGGSRGAFGRASPGGFYRPPSPGHPAIQKLPSQKILDETMQRLKTRGIRLVAHGVASESKRVWIKLEEDTTSLSWQTEFPRKVPNGSGEVSLVMMRGALHRIALPNILYVDVGKKTNALMKKSDSEVPESICFSLLTQNGSLDLQANSRLERDALVSCFSMTLDEIHPQDWRSLYAESPDTSAVQSTCTGSDLNNVAF